MKYLSERLSIVFSCGCLVVRDLFFDKDRQINDYKKLGKKCFFFKTINQTQ